MINDQTTSVKLKTWLNTNDPYHGHFDLSHAHQLLGIDRTLLQWFTSNSDITSLPLHILMALFVQLKNTKLHILTLN